MNAGAEEPNAELLEQISSHDELARTLVADFSEIGSGASFVADGRATDLPDFNHAALLRSGTDNFLEGLMPFFAKRGRRPAVILDPGCPDDLPARLLKRGFTRIPTPSDLMLWNPDARHIYTAGEVYMTLATNATLPEWLRIATIGMPGPMDEHARTMLTLQFRTPGFTFWFGQFNGIPAGACPLFVHDGMAQSGPVCVLPEYRGKGVGLALLNYVTRQSRKDGAVTTYLYNTADGPASGLCRTAGYQTVAPDTRQVWVLNADG